MTPAGPRRHRSNTGPRAAPCMADARASARPAQPGRGRWGRGFRPVRRRCI